MGLPLVARGGGGGQPGDRAILTPGNLYYLTAVDLALSVVIIFLLGAITVRALMHIHDRAELRLLRRRPRH